MDNSIVAITAIACVSLVSIVALKNNYDLKIIIIFKSLKCKFFTKK
ncbi:hypothetical protein CcarbDRAFT_5229 [Clostridium carboxidivorans P7]|uniref:Uncharacterized protein n=1 Tax=Clostridium carboxidivorans P7 TaxID=536227 RepID=C6Q2G1_9CLOT|nr:hypothetical protein [Clostridium carboxidivorans]EET84325.1 hypothetical protein CcarbDRAFT_5229 [Clostridium carboxidivorans P7]